MLGMKDKQKQTNATLGVVHCIFFNVLLANVTVVLALNNVNLFTMLADQRAGERAEWRPCLVGVPAAQGLYDMQSSFFDNWC